jgi:PST family polysaccharide transporter
VGLERRRPPLRSAARTGSDEPLIASDRLPPGSSGGVRRIAARGTVINAAFTVGLDTLNLLRGFIVAALLVPGDYGVWTILLIGLGTLGLLKEGVVGDKYVQQDEADQERAFQRAFTLEAILNLILLLVAAGALPLIALAYGESEVLLPGLVLLIVIPVATLQSPLWVFYRQMRFLEQRKLQAVDPIVAFVVTVAMAALGAGYWSFIAGTIAGRLAGAAAAVQASPYRLGFVLERGPLREYVGFSGPLFVASASRIVGVQAVVFAGEAKLGLAGAGIIGLASSIRAYGDRVDAIVTQTMYPAICAVRDRTDLLFEAFVKSNRLGLMWGMPFGVALALFAPDLVEFVYGDEWEAGLGLIQAFGLIAAFNHIGYNWTAFFRARGETKPIGVLGVIAMVGMLGIAVPLLVAEGLDGLAAGMAIVSAVLIAGRVWYLSRLFPSFQILVHSARAVAPSVPAAAAVLLMRAVTDLDRTPALAVAELGLYVVVTAIATYAFERPLLREVRGYLRAAPDPA